MSQGSESGAAPLHGAHILVVEDDFVLRLELETVLRGAGAAVVRTCATVAEALRSIDGEKFAAAILDMRLGRETVAPVARKLADLGTPFVFYTGQVASDAVIAQWPKVPVVSKPALPVMLIRAVSEVLRSSATPHAHDR